MNKELIQKFLNKACYDGQDQCELEDWLNVEKFTELIVRECAKVAWYHTPDTEELEYSHLIEDEILKHFGVEEQSTESNELHTCPYAEEIGGDYETLCDCDEERTRQCAMDI